MDIRDASQVPGLALLNFRLRFPTSQSKLYHGCMSFIRRLTKPLSLIEITVGIICACMPVCVPLIRKLPSPNDISFSSIRFPLHSFLPFRRSHSSGRSSSRVKHFLRGYLPIRFAYANRAPMAADRRQKVASKAPRLGYLNFGSVMGIGGMVCIPLQIHQSFRWPHLPNKQRCILLTFLMHRER